MVFASVVAIFLILFGWRLSAASSNIETWIFVAFLTVANVFIKVSGNTYRLQNRPWRYTALNLLTSAASLALFWRSG